MTRFNVENKSKDSLTMRFRLKVKMVDNEEKNILTNKESCFMVPVLTDILNGISKKKNKGTTQLVLLFFCSSRLKRFKTVFKVSNQPN